ncbi:hypothetical protein, partial [Adlercreutzia sp.]|uniref:hypothetical protein n=1 Tax=Adlercreutzia sp. TaxID=1872387 RepID=UPI002E7797FC
RTASRHSEWPPPTTFHVPVQACSLLVPNWVFVLVTFFELLDIAQARCRANRRKHYENAWSDLFSSLFPQNALLKKSNNSIFLPQ